MTKWQVDFFGSPQARSNAGLVTLDRQRAWALLASLLLEPQTTNREVLAARFWADGGDDRKSLGMAFASLRQGFGDDCFRADRRTISAVQERFTTDFDRIARL